VSSQDNNRTGQQQITDMFEVVSGPYYGWKLYFQDEGKQNLRLIQDSSSDLEGYMFLFCFTKQTLKHLVNFFFLQLLIFSVINMAYTGHI